MTLMCREVAVVGALDVLEDAADGEAGEAERGRHGEGSRRELLLPMDVGSCSS